MLNVFVIIRRLKIDSNKPFTYGGECAMVPQIKPLRMEEHHGSYLSPPPTHHTPCS